MKFSREATEETIAANRAEVSANRLRREIANTDRKIDRLRAEREASALKSPNRIKAPKLGRKPKFTTDELRAMHKRLSTLAYNPYDAHHDAVNSVIAKLAVYLGVE